MNAIPSHVWLICVHSSAPYFSLFFCPPSHFSCPPLKTLMCVIFLPLSCTETKWASFVLVVIEDSSIMTLLSQSLLCAIVCHTVASLCHVTVLYFAGAESNIRKAPSQPLWLTFWSGFHSMKTQLWPPSGMLMRILLLVWAPSLRAWRIWKWSRQIQAAVERDVKKQTAAGEEKKWTWTFQTSNKSPVLGPLTAPPAQEKA